MGKNNRSGRRFPNKNKGGGDSNDNNINNASAGQKTMKEYLVTSLPAEQPIVSKQNQVGVVGKESSAAAEMMVVNTNDESSLRDGESSPHNPPLPPKTPTVHYEAIYPDNDNDNDGNDDEQQMQKEMQRLDVDFLVPNHTPTNHNGQKMPKEFNDSAVKFHEIYQDIASPHIPMKEELENGFDTAVNNATTAANTNHEEEDSDDITFTEKGESQDMDFEHSRTWRDVDETIDNEQQQQKPSSTERVQQPLVDADDDDEIINEDDDISILTENILTPERVPEKSGMTSLSGATSLTNIEASPFENNPSRKKDKYQLIEDEDLDNNNKEQHSGTATTTATTATTTGSQWKSLLSSNDMNNNRRYRDIVEDFITTVSDQIIGIIAFWQYQPSNNNQPGSDESGENKQHEEMKYEDYLKAKVQYFLWPLTLVFPKMIIELIRFGIVSYLLLLGSCLVMCWYVIKMEMWLVFLPWRILQRVFHWALQSFVHLAVRFVNNARGGNKIPKALNGHVMKHHE